MSFIPALILISSPPESKVIPFPTNKTESSLFDLSQMLVRMGQDVGLSLIKIMQRSIVGMSNTMRREQILLLQKA